MSIRKEKINGYFLLIFLTGCDKINKTSSENNMKEFLNYFNIFELNLTRRDYKSPIIRMVVSIALAMAVCLARLSVTITNTALNVIISLICIAVVVMSILCFFIASVECLQVGDNRKKDKARANDKYK